MFCRHDCSILRTWDNDYLRYELKCLSNKINWLLSRRWKYNKNSTKIRLNYGWNFDLIRRRRENKHQNIFRWNCLLKWTTAETCSFTTIQLYFYQCLQICKHQTSTAQSKHYKEKRDAAWKVGDALNYSLIWLFFAIFTKLRWKIVNKHKKIFGTAIFECNWFSAEICLCFAHYENIFSTFSKLCVSIKIFETADSVSKCSCILFKLNSHVFKRRQLTRNPTVSHLHSPNSVSQLILTAAHVIYGAASSI